MDPQKNNPQSQKLPADHVKAPYDSLQYSKGATLRHKRIRLLTIVLLIFLGTSVWIFFVSVDVIPNPFSVPEAVNVPMIKPKPKKPTVQLQKEYQNPFDQKTQYVNPFSSYKNPFDTLNAK